MDLQRDSGGAGLFDGAAEFAVFGAVDLGEDQVPILVIFDRAHKRIGDADRDIEIGDGILVGLAGDEIFDIRVIDPQHAHVGAAPAAALGDFAKGIVVDAQEADRSGCLPGRSFDQRALGAQAREGEAIAAAGLLDQRRVAQGGEDTGLVAAHVIGDGQDKAGRKLAERGACAGKGR